MSEIVIETTDEDDLIAAVGRHWGLLLTFGILSVILGVVVLVWPEETVVVLAVLFGINLVITGIFQLVSSFAAPDLSGGYRALLAIVGVLGIVVGVFCLKNIFETVVILAVLIGLFWIINGIGDLFAGFSGRGPGRGWRLASGVLGLIAGIIVLAWPAPTLLVITVVAGIWLIIYGLIAIVGSFGLRRFSRRHLAAA